MGTCTADLPYSWLKPVFYSKPFTISSLKGRKSCINRHNNANEGYLFIYCNFAHVIVVIIIVFLFNNGYYDCIQTHTHINPHDVHATLFLGGKKLARAHTSADVLTMNCVSMVSYVLILLYSFFLY